RGVTAIGMAGVVGAAERGAGHGGVGKTPHIIAGGGSLEIIARVIGWGVVSTFTIRARIHPNDLMSGCVKVLIDHRAVAFGLTVGRRGVAIGHHAGGAADLDIAAGADASRRSGGGGAPEHMLSRVAGGSLE